MDVRGGGTLGTRTLLQGLASPPLAYGLDARATIADVAVDAAAAVAMTADATRAGVAAFELGGAADAACARDALRVRDARVDAVSLDFGDAALALDGAAFAASAAAPGGALEAALAAEVAPAAAALVDGGFDGFAACAARAAIAANAAPALTRALRRAAAASEPEPARAARSRATCAAARAAAAPPAVIALDASGPLRSAADAARGLQLAGPLRGFAESLAGGDGRVVVSRRGARVAIGPLRSAVAVSDVFLANAASIDDVRAFPRGADSLLDATTVELLSLRAGFGRGPVVGGATLTFDTPFGSATAALNGTFSRVAVDAATARVVVDGAAFDGLSGADVGLDEFFDASGELAWQCLLGTLGGAGLERAKLRVGRAGARAASATPGAAELVEDAVGAAVAVVGRYVDPAAARREALWLANDAFHDFLARSKRSCVRKRPAAAVAPRVDARGERPAAAATNDPGGVDGEEAALLGFASILGLLGTMLLGFGAIWARRRAKAEGKRVPEPRADAGHRSLMADAPVPRALKLALLAILLGNGALLATSNVALAAEIRARVNVELAGRAETLWVDAGSKFSLAESVGKLWDAKSYALAILIAALSGAWPYAELGCLLWGYCARGVPPARRESVFKTVEMLSKWSFIDVFIVVLLVVACHVGVAVDARTASLELDVFVGAAQESEIPNFKGSYLGRFPLVSADFWTSDHLSERSRSVDAFSGTRARGTLTLKRR